MRHFIAACLLLCLAAAPARAHPGVGIVADRQNNVFYTDLVHVWRIAPNGSKSIAVRNVHSHELAIDSLGNLFGEDSEYLGGDRYRHRVWRRSPDGRIADVIPWRDGFWREYGFVRDRGRGHVLVQCPQRRCVIRKRTPEGASHPGAVCASDPKRCDCEMVDHSLRRSVYSRRARPAASSSRSRVTTIVAGWHPALPTRTHRSCTPFLDSGRMPEATSTLPIPRTAPWYVLAPRGVSPWLHARWPRGLRRVCS